MTAPNGVESPGKEIGWQKGIESRTRKRVSTRPLIEPLIRPDAFANAQRGETIRATRRKAAFEAISLTESDILAQLNQSEYHVAAFEREGGTLVRSVLYSNSLWRQRKLYSPRLVGVPRLLTERNCRAMFAAVISESRVTICWPKLL